MPRPGRAGRSVRGALDPRMAGRLDLMGPRRPSPTWTHLTATVRRFRPPTLLALATACALLAASDRPARRDGAGREAAEHEAGPYPSDWFGFQRAYPFETINQKAFRAAVEQARFERAAPAGSFEARAAAALTWTQAGPYNIGGRITALAVTPNETAIYAASANGGVFKSTDGGNNFSPVFDDLGIYSIGALALDPANPGVLYVGTGEANSSVDSYDGAGLFRSPDGGATWSSLGLEETRRIARVAVDPQNSSRILVAAMGTQFSTSPDRGLYRSEDGGTSWSKVLFVSDSTGACDVVFNPAHSETVFCATWERVRRYTYRRAYGPECGIWRSVDHGTTWARLSAGLPAPSDNVSRIALGIAASQPSTIYAQIVSQSGGSYDGLGMFRSLDGGNTWTRRDAGTFSSNFGGFGWYFGDMAVDPTNPDRIYTLGVDLYRSSDGGVSYTLLAPGHVDQHALWIDPASPQRIFSGNDGGFFASTTGGSSWTKSLDLPITQFYAGTIDPTNPSRVMGGAQDNGTLITSGSPTAWTQVLGGDGFQCIIDPVNPALTFSEWQNCCDRSGPRRGGGAPVGFSPTDRYGWMTPIAMDPGNHNVLLVGSQRVYRSTDNGVSYTPISGDLTTNPVSTLVFGTISTLSISPLAAGVYYAGTDDGRVWRTPDAGTTWIEITSGLPVRSVTRVVADPFVRGAVYVTLSGFGQDEHLAHVYRSVDDGATWTSISGNLPDAPANDLIVDPADPNTLFLATDVGVYITRNLGAGWEALGTGMPVQTVFDLTFHAPSRTLVAATHGRSQWKLDLSSWPTAAPPQAPAARLALAPPAPNPSRGSVTMALDVGSASRVSVEVYDAAGRRVRTLLAGAAGAPRVTLAWDGLDERGHRAGAGVYFVRAEAGGSSSIRRLVRLD